MTRSKSEEYHYEELDKMREDMADIQDNVKSLYKAVNKDVRYKAQGNIKMARERGEQVLHQVEDQVRENPGRTILMAFAGGLLASALLRR